MVQALGLKLKWWSCSSSI